MSKEQASAFLDAALASDELVLEIKRSKGEKDAILAIAKREGYDFTWEEFIEASSERSDEPDTEMKLSDEELEAVAGGRGPGVDGIETFDTSCISVCAICPYTWHCPTRDISCFPDIPDDPGDGEIPPPLPPPPG